MNRALFLAIMLCGTAAPAAYSTTANDVSDSVHQWEKATKVNVDAGALTALADQAEQVDLSTVFVPPERHDQALAWTRDVLVRAWLYAVRDRDRQQATITKDQIDGYPLADFIRSAAPARDPFGNIEFLSLPAGARILRDQQEIGRTPMGFLISGDTHVYDIVLSKAVTCESTIQVRPGTTERMTCPQ